MWVRRIAYLASLLGCLVLYIYFMQWAVWVLLWWLISLPILSLVLSLPAMLTAKYTIDCPKTVNHKESVTATLKVQCRFPVPPCSFRLQVRHCITGTEYKNIDTTHCGALDIRAGKLKVHDYLGLFSCRVRNAPNCRLTVEPTPLQPARLPEESPGGIALVPKRGGGFSEEHELRDYLPGDDLRQIHWKLTAKTGKPVVKQPMEQKFGFCVLTVLLRGQPEELDRQLARLVWLTDMLIRNAQRHQVVLLSGRGLEEYEVSNSETRQLMLDAVFSAPQADSEVVLPKQTGKPYIVGGQEDG